MNTVISTAPHYGLLGTVVPYSGKLSREIFYKLEDNFYRLLTCAAEGCHAPKFRKENFCEQPQNLKIRKSFLPQKFPAVR